MTLSSQLKLLANGINPETGEVLEEGSLANRPDVIRVLFALAEELSDLDKPAARGPKLTLDERRQKNIADGRPPKSHFPWSDEERTSLTSEFNKNPSVIHLATLFERSALAIAVQLQKLRLISEEELESYRQQ